MLKLQGDVASLPLASCFSWISNLARRAGDTFVSAGTCRSLVFVSVAVSDLNSPSVELRRLLNAAGGAGEELAVYHFYLDMKIKLPDTTGEGRWRLCSQRR